MYKVLNTRERLEEIEKNTLAPYACLSINSKGRFYQEVEPSNRTRFQRDRDRIIHTTAFRRLEYKTQVFINYEGDHYRTRLTHTLEVAQIARSIATALGANTDLTEAICLVHDIGHPPFGHAGEHILNILMQEHGGFEHNRQSYRVVTELEIRYPDFPGLNLTHETLEGISKHQTAYAQPLEEDHTPTPKGHIEAQIADMSDALAYTAHDLDDGLRSGMINPRMLQDIEWWKLASSAIISGKNDELNDLERHQIVRKLISLEIQQLLENTESLLKINTIQTVDDVRSLPYNVIGFNEPYQKNNQQLKSFLYEFMYYQYRVRRMTFKAENVISELFNSYCRFPEILPPHILVRMDKMGKERTICDYIAGMTDRYAIEEHQKINNPAVMP